MKEFSTTRVELQLQGGSRIYGVLYQDCNAKANAPAALVLHGTALTHSSMAPAIAIPLARSGVVVLAIDLRGHGRSTGEVARDEYVDLHGLMSTCPELPEVEAAIAYLRARPNVDRHRVALVGCSRGGWMATVGGMHDKEVACVVAISSAPTFCDQHYPRNMLFVGASLDSIIPAKSEATNLPCRRRRAARAKSGNSSEDPRAALAGLCSCHPGACIFRPWVSRSRRTASFGGWNGRPGTKSTACQKTVYGSPWEQSRSQPWAV